MLHNRCFSYFDVVEGSWDVGLAKVDNTPKLESIGQAIAIIKGIEDAKSEKRKNGDGKNKAKK